MSERQLSTSVEWIVWRLEGAAIWLHRRIICRPGCGCPHDLARAPADRATANRQEG